MSSDDLGSGTNDAEQALSREIRMARNIPTALLSGVTPKLPSGEMSGVSIPARLIGGDYFDFYPLGNGKVRIVIGDVMGKGIPAAMLMILTRGAFRSAAESTPSPGETLTAMNNALFSDLRKLSSFVTVFCADWDPETLTLTYSNAGHSLPIIIRGFSNVIQATDVRGVMLGGLQNQKYKEGQISLKASDIVFFYTDGIVEAMNQNGEMFKHDRLIEVLFKYGHLHVEELQQQVIDAVNEFTEGLTQRDDITIISLKVGEGQIDSFNLPHSNP
jgi:sigma-B regulation protein RsbU (phosphoserine phosphatase)